MARRQRNGGSAAVGRMPIEDLIEVNPDFRERVDRADERINKMLLKYLEKKDKEASEQQPAKQAMGISSAAGGSRDPRFSIYAQGVDAVSSDEWDFTEEVQWVKFLLDVDRRGPPLLWVHWETSGLGFLFGSQAIYPTLDVAEPLYFVCKTVAQTRGEKFGVLRGARPVAKHAVFLVCVFPRSNRQRGNEKSNYTVGFPEGFKKCCCHLEVSR